MPYSTTIGAVVKVPPTKEPVGQALGILTVAVFGILFVRWLGRYSLYLTPFVALLVAALAYSNLRSITPQQNTKGVGEFGYDFSDYDEDRPSNAFRSPY